MSGYTVMPETTTTAETTPASAAASATHPEEVTSSSAVASAPNSTTATPHAPSSATSMTPAVAPVTTTATPAWAAVPPHANPKVNELHTMFPTVEIPVIEMILESCEGSQDRAIEQLLSMTDENFKPDELSAARREEASQLDLDAEFARSLQMQDDEDLRRSRTYSGAPPPPGGLAGGELPYQPRVRRARPPQQQQQQQQGQYPYGAGPVAGGGVVAGPHGDMSPEEQRQMQDRYGYSHVSGPQRDNEQAPGMMMVEEKLEKFAEVGKQTFNSLLSKAKAKYSEYQAQQAATAARTQQEQVAAGQGQGYGYGQQGLRTGWGGGSTSAPGGGRGGAQNWAQAPGGAHGQQRGGLWEDSRSFDSRDESIGSESGYDRDAPTQPQPVLRQSASRWQPTDAYDDPLPPPARANSGNGNRIELNHGGRRSPATATGGTVGSPDRPAAGKIDPAKLGLLPKKKVDLLSTSPSASSTTVGLNRSSNSASPPAADPNPGLASGTVAGTESSRALMSKIPTTPPGGHSKIASGDSDDELEYTRNPFDEK